MPYILSFKKNVDDDIFLADVNNFDKVWETEKLN